MAQGTCLEGSSPPGAAGSSGAGEVPDVTPLPDVRAEAVRVLAAASSSGVVLRAVGGLAVYLRCPSAHEPPLERDYKDIDLVGRAGGAQAISDLMSHLGYSPDTEFNAIHGHQRLFFWDPDNARQLDVFIEAIAMCHVLDVGHRLDLDERTLSLADLLLSKLQVVERNEKDLKDAAAILADHEVSPQGVDPQRIAGLLAADWGWWRTATESLEHVRNYAADLEPLSSLDAVVRHAAELRVRIDEAPKSLKWKLRARIGKRVRWYDLPEEVEH
jgi:hypothetical protein